MYILHGVADTQAVFIAVALAILANSSKNTALYVPHLPALGLALSPVIAPVQSGLLIVMYLMCLPHGFLSKPTGNIRTGRLSIINLAFPNSDFMSPILSTNSSF